MRPRPVIDLLRNSRNVKTGIQRLSAGHMTASLNSSCRRWWSCRDTGANRQQPVVVGAVAEILKGVLLVGERRFPIQVAPPMWVKNLTDSASIRPSR